MVKPTETTLGHDVLRFVDEAVATEHRAWTNDVKRRVDTWRRFVERCRSDESAYSRAYINGMEMVLQDFEHLLALHEAAA